MSSEGSCSSDRLNQITFDKGKLNVPELGMIIAFNPKSKPIILSFLVSHGCIGSSKIDPQNTCSK